ncbi:protein SAR DEFICIENT 1-like [Populus alba x Populus x berolinensis]|uniref:Protein SAR DEFICIENT 1-like n=1 Tax=Populus alba x Populus x berolinensis TaxID=444605 RepID=A0AAD6LMX8_9ROSI|nr:protein SAR DEFICIENT 1-like [Populus alba x Populus x berolinensis]
MAAKRFLDEQDSDLDQPVDQKRMRTRPSFASVIGEAVMVNSLRNLCFSLEPMIRRVVNEEVESSLRRSTCSLTRSASLQIQALEASSLQLMYSKSLLLPIFTGSKIVDLDSSPLQILLVDTRGDQMVSTYLPHPLKIEVVVLDGDFPSNGSSNWTSEEFDSNIVKERTGKRPLLAGDCLTVTLRDGFAPIGEIEFTDNSSWIRSRKFRLGARVAPGSYQGVKIREAITEAFVVKDHRGELYKKHHPPMLQDEVWRLEKIGKDGAFHRKLAADGINTVQDFLKLSVVDRQKLRRILGPGMSEKMWEVTIKHARTCDLGNNHFIFHRPNCTITLNPICQIVHAMIDGNSYSNKELPSIRGYIETLVRQAYVEWNSLEEVAGFPSDSTHLLTQGEPVDQYLNQHQTTVKSFPPLAYSTDHNRYIETGNVPSNAYNNWKITSNHYHGAAVEQGIQYSISESSSDGEITSKSFINGDR